MAHANTTAAILAGGQARRFDGRDKSRLVVDGRTIIVRQLEILQRLASEVLVVGGPADRFADLPVRVVADRTPGLGALGGIATALHAASGDDVLVVACDLPFLDEGLLRRLVELAHTGDGAWVRTARGVEPLLACYRRVAAQPRIDSQITRGYLRAGDLGGVLRMIPLEGDDLARFGAPERLLANINTPEDYGRVQ